MEEYHATDVAELDLQKKNAVALNLENYPNITTLMRKQS